MRVSPVLMAIAAVVIPAVGVLGGTGSASGGAAVPVTVTPSPSPAYAGDAGDPNVVRADGTYYAFTTGTPLGNHIQVLVDTSGSPTSGYHSYTGMDYGSTALADPPAWEQPTTQTSPGVFSWGGHWLMYYDAALSGHANDTGYDCLSVATALALTPTDPQFTDDSTGPLYCQTNLGGSIDPSPFVDPATGQAYLIWKSNDGGSAQPARIWSAPLNATGTALAATPTQILYNNTVTYPWQATVEDPDMVFAGGNYYLLFSGGVYTSSSYAQGYAVCNGPLGPCSQPDPNPILSSYGTTLGPGGGSLFTDTSGSWWIDYGAWQGGSSGCTSYECGATRQLYVAPISLPSTNVEVPCSAPAEPSGYRLVGADGGVFDYGNLPYCGSMGGKTLNAPIVGMASTPTGGGYWLVASDGGLFAFGNAHFYGSMGGKHLNAPIVGLTATPQGGYYEVASDGGLFAFGPGATFHGSMGGRHLNEPVVGMAETPQGGYYEVASDGGLFAFGPGTPFLGSMGGQHLNKPVVGMAVDPAGGYYEVASDGGIFNFGAPFHGSTGCFALTRPIVGMEVSPNTTSVGIGTACGFNTAQLPGGYQFVASDGGVFSFGNAAFAGSLGGEGITDIVGMANS